MAVLPIARMGHPILRHPAEAVADPTAPEIRQLVADMWETMVAARGRGIAAPQVHVPKRVVIFHAPLTEDADRFDLSVQPLTVLINPVITFLTEETALDWEGCLSVPGLRGMVPRVTRLRYEGAGLDGVPFTREATGFHARVVQHECDHLDGWLYPQRMTDLATLGYVEALPAAAAAADD
jgi:peptide deformylase